MISQEKYIENILRREGLLDGNPVSMPMDPNDKSNQIRMEMRVAKAIHMQSY